MASCVAPGAPLRVSGLGFGTEKMAEKLESEDVTGPVPNRPVSGTSRHAASDQRRRMPVEPDRPHAELEQAGGRGGGGGWAGRCATR
jgi:hypothetical protein